MRQLAEEHLEQRVMAFREGHLVRHHQDLEHPSGLIHVLFVGRTEDSPHLRSYQIESGDTVVGRFMDKDTFDKFNVTDLVTLAEFAEVGELESAPARFRWVDTTPSMSQGEINRLRRLAEEDQSTSSA